MSAVLLWQLVRADFLERIRGGRFLFITVATAALGTLFVPGDGGWRVLTVSGYRGIDNSAWVGASVALATTVFLSLFGFYLVNDAVERDRRTGVGQILAATPVTRTLYILSKAVSNFALLTVLVGVMAMVAAAIDQRRGARDRALAPALAVSADHTARPRRRGRNRRPVRVHPPPSGQPGKHSLLLCLGIVPKGRVERARTGPVWSPPAGGCHP